MAFIGSNKTLALTSQAGKSAYEIAVLNGFKGTEAEWLESLKGEKGEIENLVQTTGDSETAVMSQKAVTEALNEPVKLADIEGVSASGRLVPNLALEREKTSFKSENGVVSYYEDAAGDYWNVYRLPISEVGQYTIANLNGGTKIVGTTEDKVTITNIDVRTINKQTVKVDVNENTKYLMFALSPNNLSGLYINKGSEISVASRYEIPSAFDNKNEYGQIFPDSIKGVKNVGDIICRAKLFKNDVSVKYSAADGLELNPSSEWDTYLLRLPEERQYTVHSPTYMRIIQLDDNFTVISGTYVALGAVTAGSITADENARYFLFSKDKETTLDYHICVGTTLVQEPIYRTSEDISLKSLSKNKDISNKTYSGLSNEFVAIIQNNYNEFLAETKGDHNKIPFVVFADTHESELFFSIINAISDVVDWFDISACINLGDTVAVNYDANYLESYNNIMLEKIPLSRRIDVSGNHDFRNDSSNLGDYKRLRQYFLNEHARYYGESNEMVVIDDRHNVKYVVLKQEMGGGGERIGTAQMKFLINELSKNDGYDIIILSHEPLMLTYTKLRDGTYKYTDTISTGVGVVLAKGSEIMKMLADYKAKTSGTITDSDNVTHSYDFSNVTGNLFMTLHGHEHCELYREANDSAISEFLFDSLKQSDHYPTTMNGTFYFAYIDRKTNTFKCWRNCIGGYSFEFNI